MLIPLIIMKSLFFASISFSASSSLKQHIACNHALMGSPHAAKYISDYLYNLGEECSGDLFLMISHLLEDPERIKHPKLETSCLMSEDVHKMAHKCAKNMSQCLVERRSRLEDRKKKLFSEYFHKVPLGWPDYPTALNTYISENSLNCIID